MRKIEDKIVRKTPSVELVGFSAKGEFTLKFSS